MGSNAGQVPIGAKVVGWINIILGALGVVFSLLVLVGVKIMGFMGGLMGGAMALTLGAFYILLVVLSLVSSVIGIVTGIYVLKLKNWARIVATILAVLALLSFPIGTVIGLVELYFLWIHEETKNAFH